MKLFLAGSASHSELPALNDARYILESFYSIKSKKDMIKKIQSKQWDMFLLDSGAYTFMVQQNKGNVDKINWEEYVNDYAKFIVDNDVQYFFELDIDSLVGIKEVERLRKILETKTNRKCIPVWHISRGKDYFIKMCKDYDYVAFGGILTDGVSTKNILKALPWFVGTAHKYNAKIHALGLTCKGIEKYDVDSADSTSWLSAGRFGALHNFNGKEIVSMSFKSKRIENHKKANNHNLEEWIKYQKYLDI